MTARPSRMRIIQHRPAADADVGRLHLAEIAFAMVPLEIQAGFAGLDDVNFLARAFADIADENPSGRRIIGHAMRTAQAEAEKFFQHIRLADERIVVRNEIIRRETVHRLARRRVADVSAATIHINPKHAGIKAFVDDLVVVADGIIAVGPVKKSVLRMKKHAAAVMPDGLVGEVHENFHRAGNGHAISVERVAFEPVVIGVGQNRIRAGCWRSPATVPGLTQV